MVGLRLRYLVRIIRCGAVLILLACGGGTTGGGDAVPVTDSNATVAVDADPSAVLYNPAEFPHFDLEISSDGMAALAAKPREYVRASFRYRNEVVHKVGVRIKGEYSYRPITSKPAFKINFDRFVPGRRFRGLRGMTFNNAADDSSHIAERLAYLVFRNAGAPAPRANNATVSVNGEFYGVYVNVETEDEVFLARWFDPGDGNLYEEMGEEWSPGNERSFELEIDNTNGDRSDLTALFAAVVGSDDETMLEDMAHILDTESFLHYCALEGIVNQWDGYAYSLYGPGNYRLYNDASTGRFTVIPWGMDMSMKPSPWGVVNIDLLDPTSPFLERCVASASCFAVYKQVLAEEAARFESLGLAHIAGQAYEQIRAELRRDTRKQHSNESCDERFAAVVEFITQRPAAVLSQLDGDGLAR